MGWGQTPGPSSGNGFGSVASGRNLDFPVESTMSFEQAKQVLIEAGATVADEGGGQWSIAFQGQAGTLFASAANHPGVITNAPENSELRALLKRHRIAYCAPSTRV